MFQKPLSILSRVFSGWAAEETSSLPVSRPGTRALPEPQSSDDENPVVAVYGRKFRTRAYIPLNKPSGEWESLKAVAASPDQWSVIKLIDPTGGALGYKKIKTCVLAEGISFLEAAAKLLEYELTADSAYRLPAEQQPPMAEFEHVRDFCLREGFVPDSSGTLHRLVDGEIVTTGEFDAEDLKRAQDIRGQNSSRDLRQAWDRTFLHDLFPIRERMSWQELDRNLTDMLELRKTAFLVYSAVFCLEKSFAGEPLNWRKIRTDIKWEDQHWERNEFFGHEDTTHRMVELALEQAAHLDLPLALKTEIKEFLTDLDIFHLITQTKMALQKERVTSEDHQQMGDWVKAVRDRMERRGFDQSMIARAEQAMADPQMFSSIPDEVYEQRHRLMGFYDASAKLVRQKLDRSSAPQP